MGAHGHGHGGAGVETTPRPRLATALAAIVGLVAAAAIAGMVVLWPATKDVPRGEDPYGGEGVAIVDATVTGVEPFDCENDGTAPNSGKTILGDCAVVSVTVDSGDAEGEAADFLLDSTRFASTEMAEGDGVQLIELTPPGQETSWEFYDHQRGAPLLWLALAFAVLVVLIGRWRGLFALVGIAVTLAALVWFILPALLSGQPALAVAIVGSTAIMISVLYLAHGISIRTTAALFGTLFGIAFTALLGAAATGWAHLTGVGSEDDFLLAAEAPAMRLSGVVAATMVIAGLGVLNDVTVTQASAVWELRAARPEATRRALLVSAMRIGRDHIASSVYTLVFAYAGSAIVLLLLITVYQQGVVQVLTTEQVAQEVVRTLVGAIGLVLAVPVTTAIAAALAPTANTAVEQPAGPSTTAVEQPAGSSNKVVE